MSLLEIHLNIKKWRQINKKKKNTLISSLDRKLTFQTYFTGKYISVYLSSTGTSTGRKIDGYVRCSFCCVAILVACATNAVKIKPRKARSATPNLDSVASRHCKTQQQKQAKQIFQPPPPEHCFFCFYLPLNALILSSRSKYTKKRKRPENRQKQPNFRGLDFCLIFLLLRVHQSTRRDVKDCR